MNRVILGVAILLLLVGGVIWVSRLVERASPRQAVPRFSPLPTTAPLPSFVSSPIPSPSIPPLGGSPYPTVSPVLPRSGTLPVTGI